MSCRLLAQLVRAEHPDWKGRDVTYKVRWDLQSVRLG